MRNGSSSLLFFTFFALPLPFSFHYDTEECSEPLASITPARVASHNKGSTSLHCNTLHCNTRFTLNAKWGCGGFHAVDPLVVGGNFIILGVQCFSQRKIRAKISKIYAEVFVRVWWRRTYDKIVSEKIISFRVSESSPELRSLMVMEGET